MISWNKIFYVIALYSNIPAICSSYSVHNEDINISPRHISGTAISIYSNINNESSKLLNNYNDYGTTSNEIITNNSSKLRFCEKKDMFYRDFDSLEMLNKFRNSLRQEKLLIHLNGDEKFRKVLGKKVQEEVIYKPHCYLDIIYYNIDGKDRLYNGSGILISDNTILTAAHNLYDDEDGGYPDQIDVFVACYEKDFLAKATVLPKINKQSVFVPKNYEQTNGHDSSSDIGLIIFDEQTRASIHQQVGYYARPLTYSADLFNKIKHCTFHITGYPGIKNAHTMQGTISTTSEENIISYVIDTEKGQSGSGIWFMVKGNVYCIGVHTHSGKNGDNFNLGNLINLELSDKIFETYQGRKK